MQTPDKWMRDEARRKRQMRRRDFSKRLAFVAFMLVSDVAIVGALVTLEPIEPAHAEGITITDITPPQANHFSQPTKMVAATVTAYTSSEDETDDRPWETANGNHAGHGSIACPSKYEFGTTVEIEGSSYTCDDRMNARYRDEEHFDVWMATKTEAKEWGVRKTSVAIGL